MESFKELIGTIPDATYLLTPSTSLAERSLKTLEVLTESLQEYILTKNFDEEQIWGQISLLSKKISKKLDEEDQLVKAKALEKDNEDDEDISVDSSHGSQDNESDLEKHSEDDEEEIADEAPQKIQEDQEDQEAREQDFFNPDEMVRFADEGDMEKDDPGFSASDEESESQSEDEEVKEKYQDFYKDPEEHSSEEEQEKMFSLVDEDEMERLEEKLVNQKPWQMKGEINSKSRPKNSLLDEELDFEIARNPAPQTQTKEVTDEIENIIKQRILDMLYDDVKPKRPVEKVETKTAAEDFMDYEKSKKSLAELYEEDFKKQVLHIPVNTETERAKKEVTVIFRKLCYNLDLMSSLHPVAKPVLKDLEIKSASVPALVLEEQLPFGKSSEGLKTPNEVFDPKNAVLKSKEEHTKSDKNAIRKRHKSTLRTRRKERVMKIMNKMAQDPKGQKFEYRRLVKEEKARKELLERKKQPKTKFTRSSEFFKNFQELSQEMKTEKKKKIEKSEPKPSKKIKL
ncbi:hypothetical protein SteCoe_28836 [Stentor coeruleus]|uniref:Uncharacterized protein n=1 Tax=Stentor coeruleus TaxID=5963 RepID=A0A1R2B7C5_9CILI|nr:hypothetical protein SteCoe_28836 [Stentor coeruleus]